MGPSAHQENEKCYIRTASQLDAATVGYRIPQALRWLKGKVRISWFGFPQERRILPVEWADKLCFSFAQQRLRVGSFMAKLDNNFSVHVSTSHLDVAALLASFREDSEFKRRLEGAGVLIVPTDLSPEHEGPVFPDTTRPVFQLLRRGVGTHTTVDAAICDDDYVEFEYHSDAVILPVLFIADTMLLPLVVNLLASYVQDRLGRWRDQKGEDTVTSEFHFKGSDGTQMSLKYNGPAATYERVTLQQFSELGISSSKGSRQDGEDSDTSKRD